MPRKISTVVAGVYRFDATIRREGRGRRIAIPAPIARGLRRTGWDGKAPLRAVLADAAWTATARRMGKATVMAIPARCGVSVGDVATVEVWRPGAAPRRYRD